MTVPQDSTALRGAFTQLRAEVGKAVVGQDGAVTGVIVALLANGHVLLEGVPGVAKTLLVRTLSAAMSLQTTPAPTVEQTRLSEQAGKPR